MIMFIPIEYMHRETDYVVAFELQRFMGPEGADFSKSEFVRLAQNLAKTKPHRLCSSLFPVLHG